MHLRHIRPGTVDWNDATIEDEDSRLELSPEEKEKLRRLGEPEPLSLAPMLHNTVIARSLL